MTKVAVGNHSAASEICQALGVRDVVKLVLTMEVNEAVTLDVTSFVRDDDLKAIVPIMKRFRLEEK